MLQKTFKNSLTYSGVGLHSGKKATIRCLPSEVDSGIVFIRSDLNGNPMIKAIPENVMSTVRCTCLGNKDDKVIVNAVEHLLAAFVTCGINNAIVEIDEVEVPAGDGSALLFSHEINACGIEVQSKEVNVAAIRDPFFLREKDMIIVALPFDGFRISYTLSYDHPYIGTQYLDFILDEKVLMNEIAPARTFGIAEEIDELHKNGLAIGGSLENAVLISKEGPVNKLRFENELVRHKILDMVGDLSLCGRVQGHFIGIKSGHMLNVKLSKLISGIGDQL